ncbi:hypothetical protein [Rummeliibacillus stabekisii]|uniref:hypothetical protein n=1 Tax=Rummeliibacillus stabekisii TaxID=241244 RepID=UPI00371CBABF
MQDYWVFVLNNNQIQKVTIAAPEMDLEDSKEYFKNILKVPILEVGYGTVPKGFRKLKEFEYCV